jgi:hypothetical protein
MPQGQSRMGLCVGGGEQGRLSSDMGCELGLKGWPVGGKGHLWKGRPCTISLWGCQRESA